MASKHSSGSIGVHDCNIVYVLVDDVAAFEAIQLEEGEGGKCRAKVIEQGKMMVVFQYWGK